MGQLKVEGSLIAGPPSATDVFPAGVLVHPLSTAQSPKGFQVATGVLTRNLSSALAYLAFPELGTNAAVTRANFLYIRTDSPMLVRMTTDDGSGGNVVSVVPIHGLGLWEFQDAKYLKLLEVQGSGKIEYLLCGQQ